MYVFTAIPSSTDYGLSGGVIAAIIIAVVLAVLIIVAILVICWIRGLCFPEWLSQIVYNLGFQFFISLLF